MSHSSSVPQKLTDERHVNLYSTNHAGPKGTTPWVFASRKSPDKAGSVSPDAVAIVAIVNAAGTPRLLVTREFRAPLGRYELSVPSGLVDEGESVETAAARELREETGLTLSKVLHVSPPVASSAGLTDETVCLLYGEATGTIAPDFQTGHEDIEAKLLSLADIRLLLITPAEEVISSRLYPMLVGFVAAASFGFPSLE